ncbi:MAG: hypothetical protein PHR68_04800 [Candidatus Gracilibacteria bacterium]|nr:hypothetical protein [Candidatus Gracilibacteria bacterium]
MKKNIFMPMIITLAMLLTYNSSFAAGDIKVEAKGSIASFDNIKFDVNSFVSKIGTKIEGIFSKSDYDKIGVKINSDTILFSDYMKQAKKDYKSVNAKKLRDYKLKIYNIGVKYCGIQKTRQANLWNAYNKDLESLLPTGYEKPGTYYLNLDCDTFGINILKYVMNVK